jgi:hypothetical protein
MIPTMKTIVVPVSKTKSRKTSEIRSYVSFRNRNMFKLIKSELKHVEYDRDKIYDVVRKIVRFCGKELKSQTDYLTLVITKNPDKCNSETHFHMLIGFHKNADDLLKLVHLKNMIANKFSSYDGNNGNDNYCKVMFLKDDLSKARVLHYLASDRNISKNVQNDIFASKRVKRVLNN